MTAATWQNGTEPAPKGYAIRCTGCSHCERDGHLPMRGTIRSSAWAMKRSDFERLRNVVALDMNAGEV